jgi:site-specific recombinase XerD
MADKDSRMLTEAIQDYLDWIKSVEEHRGKPTRLGSRQRLIDFLIFAISKEIAWEEMFTRHTLEAFRIYSGFKSAPRAIINLSQYLFTHGRIDQPIQIHKPKASLPDIYEQYLLYQKQGLKASSNHFRNVKGLLRSFHHYLENQGITLSDLNINHLDAFMAAFKVTEATRRVYRHLLRGFLKYLYYEKGIIKKDYAPLVVGPRLFDQQKPPKFLRPKEVQKLFSSLKLSSPADIRTYAMVHLAYSLGLRPVEISRITFDDVAAYVLNARPKSPSRYIFLSFHFPYRPVSAHTVLLSISRAMKKAGLPSTSYWLRHTYAQNLLQMGHPIREIKEMLGHDIIESTRRYLSIHTEMMRKVVFDEEL